MKKPQRPTTRVSLLMRDAMKAYLDDLRRRVCKVACTHPPCRQPAGKPCISPWGKPTKNWHGVRAHAARRAGFIDGLHKGERIALFGA